MRACASSRRWARSEFVSSPGSGYAFCSHGGPNLADEGGEEVVRLELAQSREALQRARELFAERRASVFLQSSRDLVLCRFLRLRGPSADPRPVQLVVEVSDPSQERKKSGWSAGRAAELLELFREKLLLGGQERLFAERTLAFGLFPLQLRCCLDQGRGERGRGIDWVVENVSDDF